MKTMNSFYQSTPIKLFISLGAIVLVIALIVPALRNYLTLQATVNEWKSNGSPVRIIITYPLDQSLFPPGIPPPTIRWKDEYNGINSWIVTFSTKSDGRIFFQARARIDSFQPGSDAWRRIQKASVDSTVVLTILGIKNKPNHHLASGASVEFATSHDPVDAPIFFRQVPLPFDRAFKHPDLIRYCLGWVDSSLPPKILLENLSLCGNCHSFSRDGKTMGMDVDYANDKGSYAIAELEPRTVLSPDKIITWSDYKRQDGHLTFGLLSQVSPDGRYVMSTVKDRSVFVSLPERFEYSQLFFPIRGILAFYDRGRREFHALPGADDPRLVQSNPNWTPDGKHLLFARTKAYVSPKIEASSGIVLPAEDASEFLTGKRPFQYDIFRIPFNSGTGGKAEPVQGASNNGMSNYFPRVTPDGKWLVFTQARNFMLLQPDSKLMIAPASGGIARVMRCNRGNMNSWHSFSPNSRWMVFASKERGPYTQLWLTHIDENGEDSPPVLLEHLLSPDRAANIPEFITPSANMVQQLVDGFSDSGNYNLRSARTMIRAGDLQGAEMELNRALSQNSRDIEALYERGALLQRLNRKQASIADFEAASALAPHDFRSPYNLGVAHLTGGQVQEAIADFTRALTIDSNATDCWQQRALAKLRLGDSRGAEADAERAIQCDTTQLTRYIFAAKIYMESNDKNGAIAQLDRALRINPRSGPAWLNRAYSNLLAGKISLAEENLHKGRMFADSDPLIPLIEGMLAFKCGNVGKGCEILQDAKRRGKLGSYAGVADELISRSCGN